MYNYNQNDLSIEEKYCIIANSCSAAVVELLRDEIISWTSVFVDFLNCFLNST